MTSDHHPGAVRWNLDGDVLWAVIERPRKRNAIDRQALAGLEAMIAAAREGDVKVVVLSGAGSFCAGADLHEVRAMIDDPSALRAFMSRFGDVLVALEQAPWVNVAVVEGHAVAGGCELLLACDIAIASTDARIGDRHVEYGLAPAAGGSVRLPLAVPPGIARALLLTGDLLSGTQAAQIGLVAAAVAPEELDREVDRLVERLRSRGPRSLQTVKTMLADKSGARGERLARELDLFVEHAGSHDVRAGLRAFRDGVPATFEVSTSLRGGDGRPVEEPRRA